MSKLGGFGATLAASCVAAQPALYTEMTATHLPSGLAGPCMSAAAGDADGDGDLDLALAMEFEPKVLLVNDGSGVFADGSAQMPRTVHDSEDVAFADFDGDGDLDLVFVSEDDRVDELFLNLVAGRYSDASPRLRAGDTVSNALVVVDLNGDGSPDVLTGNIGEDLALINDGTAAFPDETFSRWTQHGESRTQDLELVDVDGDEDLDVVVGNEGQNELFLNDGGGRLVDATAGRLPVRHDETREIKAADFDGDGDNDLVVANVRFVTDWPRRNYLLLNDGAGYFTDAAPGRLPFDDRDDFAIAALDVDRDGDVDIISPSTVFRGGVGDYQVLLNDGRARFSTAPAGTVLPAGANGNGFDIEVADFNADGAADLFLCNRASDSRDASAAAASGGVQRLLFGKP
jgi:FG-GAP-like repeat